MESQIFSSMLRSFGQLDPIQLERAQEHLRHYLQRDQLHQALANQSEAQGKITKPRDFKGLRKRSFFEMTLVEA